MNEKIGNVRTSFMDLPLSDWVKKQMMKMWETWDMCLIQSTDTTRILSRVITSGVTYPLPFHFLSPSLFYPYVPFSVLLFNIVKRHFRGPSLSSTPCSLSTFLNASLKHYVNMICLNLFKGNKYNWVYRQRQGTN